ncbi:MAG: lysophospholipase [Candidatus Obscuribacterales bacterium]|nr:lysophospholipase [Candidatus Obscuribacterales bacterium]
MNQRNLLLTTLIALACTFSSVQISPPAHAEGNCKHHTDLQYKLKMPIYHWAPKSSAKGIVVAMHGLVMHGLSFERLGSSLANEGYLVYASDMRGYGRLTTDYPHEFCTKTDCKQKINYAKSTDDLTTLVDSLKKQNPNLPLYLVGESLGADLAIRIGSSHPELIDGLVLCSPALRANTFMDKSTLANISLMPANFSRQLDLRPYMKRYASEDPAVVSELLGDSQVRRTMSIYELLRSYKAVNGTMAFVPHVAANKPVLVMQGKSDRCVRADAVPKLMANLKSEDQKLQWFDKRGHILIETNHMKADTITTLVSWLNDHTARPHNGLQAKRAEVLVSVPEKALSDEMSD